MQRVHLLLRRVRDQCGDAVLCRRRMQAAPRHALRGDQHWERSRALSYAALDADRPDRSRLAAAAVDGTPQRRGALPAHPPRLFVLQHSPKDRLRHGHGAHARVPLLVRLPAPPIPRQNEPGRRQDRGQHGQARPRADGRGAHQGTAAEREGRRAGGATGGHRLGLCRQIPQRVFLRGAL